MTDIEVFIKGITDKQALCQTREAMKMGLIMPLFQKLNWDVFSPLQVVHDYSVTTDKGTVSVDYALMCNNAVSALIEYQDSKAALQNFGVNLYSCFMHSTAKIAILTNGIKYHIFTDSVEEHVMDIKPIYTFDLTNMSENDFIVLNALNRNNYETADIRGIFIASVLKSKINDMLDGLLKNPSDDVLMDLHTLFNKHFNKSEKCTYVGFKTAYLKSLEELNKPKSVPKKSNEKERAWVRTEKNSWRKCVLEDASIPDKLECELKKPGVDAKGCIRKDFTMCLYKGSKVCNVNNKSANFDKYATYIDATGHTTEDMVFNTITAAANFVLGKRINGFAYWVVSSDNMYLQNWFNKKAKELGIHNEEGV